MSSTVEGSGWIFSPKLDVSIFCFSLLIGFIGAQFFTSISKPDPLLPFFLFFLQVANMGHVFTTVIPVYTDKAISKRLGAYKWTLPVVTLGISLLFCFFSIKVFFNVLGTIAVSHIIMQQYGFFRISERLCPSPLQFRYSRWLENILLANLFLFPLYFWACGQSGTPFRWLTSDDLGGTWDLYVPQIHSLYFVFLAVYLAWQIYPLFIGKKLNIGKLFLTAVSFIWLYVGLVQYSNEVFFVMATFLIHGLTYILFTLKYWERSARYSPPQWVRSMNLFHLIALFIVLILLTNLWFFSMRWESPLGNFVPLLWAPLIFHYAFDAVIWRKQFLHSPQKNSGT